MFPQPEQSAASPAIEQIRAEVEARLRALAPVIEELQQLEGILSVIDEPRSTLDRMPHVASLLEGVAPADAGAMPQLRRGRRGTKPGRDGRAPQGANKQAIMRVVLARPGVTPSEIAERTGLRRTVVAATVNRLKRRGELEPFEEGVRVPLAAPSERR